jgi:Ca2+-binding RTX toxin-like protein
MTEPNNTISQAENTGLSSSGQKNILLSESIDPASDVDLYRLQVDQGDVVTLNIEARENGSGLDSVLRLFDPNGSELAFDDDDSNNQAPFETPTFDSYLVYDATTTQDYYVGVSNYPNFDYDPNTDGTGTPGFTTGDYELAITIFNGINGTQGSDSLTGTSDQDYIRGLGGNDTLSGGGQKDNILGDGGNDFLRGDSGDDLLRGGNGTDVIRAGRGNDTLGGEAGRDSLYGDQGSDIFAIGSGQDTIFDFRNGSDFLLLTNGSSFSDLNITLGTSSGTSTVISSFGSNIATLVGISPGQIDSNDFVGSEVVSPNFRASDEPVDKM